MNRYDDDIPSGLEAELVVESAFEDLTSSRPSGVDIENALETLKGLKRTDMRNIKRFLGLAARNASVWITTVGEVEPVLEALLPHLDAVRQVAEKDPSQQEEFSRVATSILVESLAASPDSYPDYLKDLIKQKKFGQPTDILTNLFTKISSKDYRERDDFFPRRVEYGLLVLAVLADIAAYRDNQLLEQVAPHIPGYLLFTRPGLVEHFRPLQRVEEILKEKGNFVPKMAEMAAEDPELFDEDMERKVLAGKFGEPRQVLAQLLKFLSSRNNLPKDITDEYREDHKLLMSILISGLFQHLDPLNTADEELKSFLWQYEEPIFAALRLMADEPNAKGLDKLINNREFTERLSNIFQAIKDLPDVFKQLDLYPLGPDDFLISSLINFRNFQELLRIKDEISGFFELFEEGRPLHDRTKEIIQDVLKSVSPLQRALEVQSIFTKNVPFWKQVFLYIETVLADELAFSKSQYPIRTSASFVVPAGEHYDLTKHHEMEAQDISSLSAWEKRDLVLDGFQNLSDEEVAGITYIPFRQLTIEAKRITILNYLRKTMSSSQSIETKQRSDERNRKLAKENLTLTEGTYLHGSDISNMDSILYHGNLSGECLGIKAKTDNYPFHVDVQRISSREAQQNRSNIRQVIEQTRSYAYGNIIYVYSRDRSSWEADVEYHTEHNLIFVGIPSTEIAGILVKDPPQHLGQARQAVLENGFYIPIYDTDGKLLFTPDDFDKVTEERNLRVPVDVWSTSLQVGDKRGSNEGGEFVVPGERGARRFYVKYYPREAGSDHLWTEQLADNIYRFVEIPVPDTRIVRVDDKFGHASEMLEPDPDKDLSTLKDGFLTDALLANWDIVYNSENTISVGGRIYRIDNGNALHYRARGRRKDNELFGPTVRELEVGRDRTRLAAGMRQEYPGLTQDDITRQIAVLDAILTPDAIDLLVDGVRLPALDRAFLKSMLTQRRSYILSYFQELRST